MPHLETDGLSLPFSGAIAVSRHCSYEGAKHASERVCRQAFELLTLYRTRGPLTDAEAADLMAIERTTVIPRRFTLIARGWVGKHGTKKNPETGITNTLWGIKEVAMDEQRDDGRHQAERGRHGRSGRRAADD